MANRDHIELLFKNYYQPLHHLASIMLRDEDQAADIVHDVFASLLKNPDLSEFQTGYLFRAVRNRCLNRIESKGFQEKVRNLLYLESEEYDSENWPEEEIVSRIHEIIDSELTPQKHKIMTLRFGDGLPFIKIAEKLGISETAVYKHVRQALEIIRNKLEQYG